MLVFLKGIGKHKEALLHNDPLIGLVRINEKDRPIIDFGLNSFYVINSMDRVL